MKLNLYQTRVRAHQTDLNAALYHGAYFDMFDDARIETFRRLGYTYERMRRGGWTAVIRSIECQFYLPARMDDLLDITVGVPRLSTARMTIRYECKRDGDLLALAHAVFAFVDDRGKAIRVPPDLRQVVREHDDVLGGATSE
jgi:acyl-CoA thioester hydrolase